jgi:chitinase
MNTYHAARDQYGFDGVDIDIEGGISNPLLQAYRKIFPLMHSEGQIVSMAPAPLFIDPEESTTFTPGAFNSYVPLIDTTMIDNVDYIAIQLYCNPMPLGDLDKYLASMQKSHKINALGQAFEINIPSSKFVFGFPSGATSGKASQAWEANPATLVAHYRASPALMATGGAMTWAIGWDATSGWKWIDAVAKLWGVGPPPAPPAPTPTPPTPPAPPAPTPTPPTPPAPTPPSPSPSPSDCPGGTLTACIALCPVDAQYAACIQDCVNRCPSSIAV